MENSNSTNTFPHSQKHLKRKRIIGIISLVIILVVMTALTFVFIDFFRQFSNPLDFREYVEPFGIWGWAVVMTLQILQVVVAFIPGEVIEIGSGFAFGAFKGTILCLVGVAIGSSMIFLLTKKLGQKFVALFTDPQRIQNLKFIRNEKRLSSITFILYLIPGTPKDLLTYCVGLTKMSLPHFLLISMIARLPSIVSSTWGGSAVANRNWLKAVIIFSVTAAVSILGLILYSALVKAKSKYKKSNNQKKGDFSDETSPDNR